MQIFLRMLNNQRIWHQTSRGYKETMARCANNYFFVLTQFTTQHFLVIVLIFKQVWIFLKQNI